MGIFTNVFGNSGTKKEQKILPWIALTNKNQISKITETSHEKPQFIFKHSTRCGVSRMVMNQFVAAYGINEDEADLYYLDLLNHRDASTEVGYTYQIMHQSPQLIVVKGGKAVAHASHGGVNEVELKSYL